MSDCVDETPGYVENQAFFNDTVHIQAYSQPWKHDELKFKLKLN